MIAPDFLAGDRVTTPHGVGTVMWRRYTAPGFEHVASYSVRTPCSRGTKPIRTGTPRTSRGRAPVNVTGTVSAGAPGGCQTPTTTRIASLPQARASDAPRASDV